MTMRPIVRYIAPVALVAAMLLVLPAAAHACPNCKEAYMADTGASVAAGYNSSILVMAAMPFVLLGGIAVRIWYTMRRNAAADVHPNS